MDDEDRIITSLYRWRNGGITWSQVTQLGRSGARIQTHMCLTPGPALKLYASWLTCLESSKGCALAHPIMASEVTCYLKPLPVNLTNNTMGLHIRELSFLLGGLFSTLSSLSSSSYFSRPLWYNTWLQRASLLGPCTCSPGTSQLPVSSWETELRAFITISVPMLHKRPVPSRFRFHKKIVFLCFVVIAISWHNVCAVENVTTSTIFVNNITRSPNPDESGSNLGKGTHLAMLVTWQVMPFSVTVS